MKDPADQKDATPEDAPSEVGFWTIVASTLAAAIGVQSRANRERDFRHGRAAPFIVAGLLFTVAFVLVLVFVVRLVLAGAG
jgi:uncharacterized membrane protein YidH (DUF202 family)